MDFTFSPEQDALRESVRRFLEAQGGTAYTRRVMEGDASVDDDVWPQVAELGWLELPGLVDLVVVQEEMGRALFPGPFLSAASAAMAARRLGEDLAGRGTLALEELGAGDPLSRVATTATPVDGDTWSLDGLKPVVLDGHTADWAIVAAHVVGGVGDEGDGDEADDGGLAAFVVERPGAEVVPALDVTRRLTRLALDGRQARRLGPEGDQTALLRRVADDVAVALCAETVGGCERALEMAIDYSKQRVQFDRPIATFQAIKHKIVDMLHQLELCRVGTHYAAWASDVDDPDRETAAAMAKGFVGEAAKMITGESIQVHGGVGFTWDVDCHLYFRRAKQNDVLCGSSGWQRQRVADLVLGPRG